MKRDKNKGEVGVFFFRWVTPTFHRRGYRPLQPVSHCPCPLRSPVLEVLVSSSALPFSALPLRSPQEKAAFPSGTPHVIRRSTRPNTFPLIVPHSLAVVQSAPFPFAGPLSWQRAGRTVTGLRSASLHPHVNVGVNHTHSNGNTVTQSRKSLYHRQYNCFLAARPVVMPGVREALEQAR